MGRKSEKLASLFLENFKQYEDSEEGKSLAKAGPTLTLNYPG